MSDYTADDLKEAILDSSGKVHWQETDTYNWDAFLAAEEKWTEEQLIVQRKRYEWDLDKTHAPKYGDFAYPEPVVVDHANSPEEDEFSYDSFLGVLSKDDPIRIDGFGEAYLVDTFGGEGEGSSYWFVFKLLSSPSGVNQITRYFKVDGYYASYDGGYYDELYEVFPKQVQVTEWTQG